MPPSMFTPARTPAATSRPPVITLTTPGERRHRRTAAAGRPDGDAHDVALRRPRVGAVDRPSRQLRARDPHGRLLPPGGGRRLALRRDANAVQPGPSPGA